ncbi:hypothetical protein, partial [Methylophilus sp. 13]|uniref:hypothetical protein n=1 Tax=Methylophilus sp. 13 TaxID=2781018 RepID=UPI001E478D88
VQLIFMGTCLAQTQWMIRLPALGIASSIITLHSIARMPFRIMMIFQAVAWIQLTIRLVTCGFSEYFHQNDHR